MVVGHEYGWDRPSETPSPPPGETTEGNQTTSKREEKPRGTSAAGVSGMNDGTTADDEERWHRRDQLPMPDVLGWQEFSSCVGYYLRARRAMEDIRMRGNEKNGIKKTGGEIVPRMCFFLGSSVPIPSSGQHRFLITSQLFVTFSVPSHFFHFQCVFPLLVYAKLVSVLWHCQKNSKSHGLSQQFIQMEQSGFNFNAEQNRKEWISGE